MRSLLLLLFGSVLLAGLAVIANRARQAKASAPLNDAAEPTLQVEATQVMDLDEAIAILKSAEKPAAFGSLRETPPDSGTDSVVGGPVLLPDGVDYPLDRLGRPMIFLIQINFSDAPAVPDLPDAGIIQLFAAADEELGSVRSVENPSGDVAVFYWSDPNILTKRYESITLDYPEGVLIYKSAWRDYERDMTVPLDIHRRGRGIVFKAELGAQSPRSGDFPVSAVFYDRHGGDEDMLDEAEDMLDEAEAAVWRKPVAVTLGGYPEFVQGDPRFPYIPSPDGRGLTPDYVQRGPPRFTQNVFTLRSVGDLMIWDAGSLNLMVADVAWQEGRIEDFLYEVAGG